MHYEYLLLVQSAHGHIEATGALNASVAGPLGVYLNQCGGDGWRVIQAWTDPHSAAFYILLERVVKHSHFSLDTRE